MPLLIDGTTSDVRLAGSGVRGQGGLADRIVYNSIQPEIDDEELHAIGQAGVTFAIVLTYNMMDFTTEGRIDSVRKLLPKLDKAGITKPIVDTCVLDMATLGASMRRHAHRQGRVWIAGWRRRPQRGRHLARSEGKDGQTSPSSLPRGLRGHLGSRGRPTLPFTDRSKTQTSSYPAVAMTDTALSQIAMDRGDKLDKRNPPPFPDPLTSELTTWSPPNQRFRNLEPAPRQGRHPSLPMITREHEIMLLILIINSWWIHYQYESSLGVVLHQHQIGTSALSDRQHCKTFFVEIRSLSALMGANRCTQNPDLVYP